MDFIGAKYDVMLVVVRAIRCAKLRLDRRRQQTNTQLSARQMSLLLSNQQSVSAEGKKYLVPNTCSPQTHVGFYRPSL